MSEKLCTENSVRHMKCSAAFAIKQSELTGIVVVIGILIPRYYFCDRCCRILRRHIYFVRQSCNEVSTQTIGMVVDGSINPRLFTRSPGLNNMSSSVSKHRFTSDCNTERGFGSGIGGARCSLQKRSKLCSRQKKSALVLHLTHTRKERYRIWLWFSARDISKTETKLENLARNEESSSSSHRPRLFIRNINCKEEGKGEGIV